MGKNLNLTSIASIGIGIASFCSGITFYCNKRIKKKYYRNRPKPLSSRDRRLYPVYKVRDVTSDWVVTLSQYNKTHKTAFTLDDVYGKGFEEKLSQKG